MADVQIAVIDQQNTQIALAAPSETEVTVAVPGVQGPVGEGVPSGGTANQVLFKQSGTDYDTAWSEVTSAMIGDLEIVNADVAAAAAIDGTKINPNFGSQNVVTTGTATAAALIPSGSSVPTNGVYLPSANNVAISTNGTGRLFVDANGDVGFGTSSPSNYRLNLVARSGYEDVAIFSSTGTNINSRINLAPTGTGLGVVNATTNALTFQVGAAERLRITSDGKLGLGDSAPANKLQILEALAAIPSLGSGGHAVAVAGSTNYGLALGGLTTGDGYLQAGRWSGTATAYNLLLQPKGGSVGIGTASPSQKLHIGGAAPGDSIIRQDATTSGTNWEIGEREAGKYQWWEDDTDQVRMTLTSGGSLGIGTTSPTKALEVAAGSTISGGLLVTGSSSPQIRLEEATGVTGSLGADSTAIYVGTVSNHPLILRANVDERARIDTSGRLLVGTSSARTNFYNTTYSSLLQVEADVSTTALASLTSSNNGTLGGLLILGHQRSGSVGGNTVLQSGDELGVLAFMGSDGSEQVEGAHIKAAVDGTPGANDLPSRLVFSTTADGASSPTERMRIGSDGLIQVSNGRLYVQVSEASSPLCHLYNTNNAASDITYRSELGAGSNGTSAYHFYGVTGGSGKFAIYGNGTYGTISDQNLKTHIEPARDGYLADLNQIKIVKYGWKSDELGHATELGVIAQEVEQVFPGLVQESPPNEDGEVFKGVKTSVFTFMLIKALQEASSKIESLESRIAALEAQ